MTTVLPWHDWVLGSPWGIQLAVSALLITSLCFAYASATTRPSTKYRSREPFKTAATIVSQRPFGMLKLVTVLTVLRYEVWRYLDTIPEITILWETFLHHTRPPLHQVPLSAWTICFETILLGELLLILWQIPRQRMHWQLNCFLILSMVVWLLMSSQAIHFLDVSLMTTSVWTWLVMAFPMVMALGLWWLISKTSTQQTPPTKPSPYQPPSADTVRYPAGAKFKLSSQPAQKQPEHPRATITKETTLPSATKPQFNHPKPPPKTEPTQKLTQTSQSNTPTDNNTPPEPHQDVNVFQDFAQKAMALPVGVILAFYWLIKKTTPQSLAPGATSYSASPSTPPIVGRHTAISSNLSKALINNSSHAEPKTQTPDVNISPKTPVLEDVSIPAPTSLHKSSGLYPMIGKQTNAAASTIQDAHWSYEILPAVCVETPTSNTSSSVPRILGMGYIRAMSLNSLQFVVNDSFELPPNFWIRIQWLPNEPVEMFPVTTSTSPNAPAVWLTQAETHAVQLHWNQLSSTQQQRLTERLLPASNLSIKETFRSNQHNGFRAIS